MATGDKRRVRRRSRASSNRLSQYVPVRFAPETIAKVEDAADREDTSVSNWIREAVEERLSRKAAADARAGA